MNNNHVYDMLVVGGGPGGYTAALYAARAGLDTVVLEKLSAGGQMALTEQIDNYPGFEDGIDGFSLAEKMQKQAERFGARSEYAEVLRMDLTAVPKLVETSEGIFRGKTVVLATGADPRTLGVAGEAELVGRGVAYCWLRHEDGKADFPANFFHADPLTRGDDFHGASRCGKLLGICFHTVFLLIFLLAVFIA